MTERPPEPAAETQSTLTSHPGGALLSDLRYPGEPILLAFAGFAVGERLEAPFAFTRATESLKVNRIFVRDLDMRCYLTGIRGVGTSIEETAATLRDLVDSVSPSTVITLGNSAGGFAALLYGALIRADICLAFAPYSQFADPKTTRNARMSQILLRDCTHSDLDLLTYLEGQAYPAQRILYYDNEDRIDAFQAQRIEHLPNITRFLMPGYGHALIRGLSKSGELTRILEAALRGETCEPDLSRVPVFEARMPGKEHERRMRWKRRLERLRRPLRRGR